MASQLDRQLVQNEVQQPAGDLKADAAHPEGRTPLLLPTSENLFTPGAEHAPKNCYHEVIMTADFSAGNGDAAEVAAHSEVEQTPVAMLIHNILSPEETEVLRAQMDDGVQHTRPNGTLERHRQNLSNRRQDRAELWCQCLADVLSSRMESVLKSYGLDKYEIRCTEGDIVDNGRTQFLQETSEMVNLVDVSNEGLIAKFKLADAHNKSLRTSSCPPVSEVKAGALPPLEFPPQDVPMLFPRVADTRDGKEGEYQLAGVSERFSFMKYLASDPNGGRDTGDEFAPHTDQTVHLGDGRQSLFTILMYVSGESDTQGGETNLLSRPLDEKAPNTEGRQDKYSVLASVKAKERGSVLAADYALSATGADHDHCSSLPRRLEPEPGSALVFFQRGMLHEGSRILSGTKTVIRSDVMYNKKTDGVDEDPAQENSGGADLKKRWKEQKARAWQICREAARLEQEGKVEAATKLYSRAYRLDDKLQQW